MPTRRATALQSGFTHSAPKPSSSLELAGSLLGGKHTQFSSSHLVRFQIFSGTSILPLGKAGQYMQKISPQHKFPSLGSSAPQEA